MYPVDMIALSILFVNSNLLKVIYLLYKRFRTTMIMRFASGSDFFLSFSMSVYF